MDDETGQSSGDTENAAFDIPDDELTPRVHAAILDLIGEIDALRADIERSKSRIVHLEALADADPLTPASNRRAFLRELERANAYAARYGAPSSVIFIDINGLKAINDGYGHAAGDQALTAIARPLDENVRASDVVGRLGGDEFGVILSHMDEAAANVKASALSHMIEKLEIERDGRAIPVSAAFGVFTLTGETDVTEALEAADKAMYQQKGTRTGEKRS